MNIMRVPRRQTLVVGLCALTVSLTVSWSAWAAVQEFTNKSAWQVAADPFTTIGFANLPANTLITDQYADEGVLFTDGFDLVMYNTGFLNDGAGVNAAPHEIWLAFTSPMASIGCDYPGSLKFYLYLDDALIYTSTTFAPGGIGNFAGLVSTQPFNRALIRDPFGDTFIDDLHFGPPIPGPGAAALICALFALRFSRRRR